MNLTTTYKPGTIALVRVRAKAENPSVPRWEHLYLGLKTVFGWTVTGPSMSAEVKDDWYHADWVVTDVIPLTVTVDAHQLGAVGLSSTSAPPGSVVLAAASLGVKVPTPASADLDGAPEEGE